jgi:hypothetical protein
MSRCLPTPSGFALYLHGDICHGPKSWCRGSPQVCCRHLVVELLSLRLAPLVGMPNEDASKNREGDESLALGGRCLVVRHNNQPIVGDSDRMDDGEVVRPGWSVWGGGVLILGRQIEWSMPRRWTLPTTTMSKPLATTAKLSPLLRVMPTLNCTRKHKNITYLIT